MRENRHFNFAQSDQTPLDQDSPGVVERLVENLLGGYGLLLGITCVGAASLLQAHIVVAIVLAEIGAVILGLSLFHMVHERLLRQRERDVVTTILRRVIAEMHVGYESLRKVGIEKAFLHLPTVMEELKQSIIQAKSIRILKTWWPSDTRLELALRETSAKTHLYLCDPDSEILKIRCLGAGENAEEAKIRNCQAVRRIYTWLQSDQKRSGSLTFYDTWPGLPIIECDGKLYLGFYSRGLPSQYTPWLRVNRESEFGKVLLEQFNFNKDQITCCLKTQDQFAAWLETKGVQVGQ